jgi:hypothetical protein
MKLHLVTEFEELEQIQAKADAATTVEEAEQADNAFFSQPGDLRAAWLEMKDPVLYQALMDYRPLTN